MPSTSTQLGRLARQCRFEFYRSSGPGGQHRNKVETAVRVVHVPTGLKAQAAERRSKEQNRRKALERLALKIEARSRSPRPRIPSRKPAVLREKELDEKKRASEKKQARRNSGD